MTTVTEQVSAEVRRETRRFTLWAWAYMASILGGAFALNALDLPKWGVILVALAPSAAALMALRAWLGWFGALDEMQRHIETKSLLIAVAVVAVASIAYGFLERWADFPAAPIVFVAPAICSVWGVVRPFVVRRYT